MSKVWRNLQVCNRLLEIQDIISTTTITTTTTASDAKLANDAHLLERELKYLKYVEIWRNLQVISRLLLIQDIISTITNTTTTTASDAKLANDAHLLEREFKYLKDVEIWRNLEVSSRLLEIQDIISTTITTTTNASDDKFANDAQFLEIEMKNLRDVERLEKPTS